MRATEAAESVLRLREAPAANASQRAHPALPARRSAGEALLAAARRSAEAGLRVVSAELEAGGMPPVRGDGQLIRPVLAYAAARAVGGDPGRDFWRGAGAVQLAHEASLVHDDIIDGATTRRGRASLAASRGVAAALVHGDHLLTASYRLAMWTGSAAFQARFAEAVERTVAGELAQGRRRGDLIGAGEYREIVLGKSGELLGCALATSALLAGDPASTRLHEVGRQLGLAYQMLDDLLDYCPAADTGKPPFADYARGHSTWVLHEWPRSRFGLSTREVHAALHGGGTASPMHRALAQYAAVCERIETEVRALLPGDDLVAALLARWSDRANRAVAAESARIVMSAAPLSFAAAHDADALALPDGREWLDFMRRHARSFRFASLLFPPAQRRSVERVYAFCRFTDDLADGADAADARAALTRLDAWERIARRAYEGHASGNVVLDDAMREMAAAGVPFDLAADLIEGMRMDLRGERYATYDDLLRYAYRVAGVVGVWLTRLFGVHDETVLERAVALGNAMQLTNIARDVGEDLDAGRVYLPVAWLDAAGLDEGALQEMRRGPRIAPAYAAVIERLLQHAESEYERAFQAIPALPAFYQRPVAVAAHVYRGIHARIRANGYDNLTRRAATTRFEKLRLAARAGLDLLRARRQWLSPGQAVATALLLACAFPMAAASQSAPCAPPATPRQHLEAVHLELATGGASEPALLDAVRAHFFVAVDDAASIDAGIATLERLEREYPRDGEHDSSLRMAYRGALTTLRAKHGSWPPQRLRDTRAGLALLDAAVSSGESYEVRYLRLISGYYLPGLFGRRGAVREDMRALVALLPEVLVPERGPLFREVVIFVIENGEHTADERGRLRALLPQGMGAVCP